MEDLAWLLDPGPQGVVISADLSNNSCQVCIRPMHKCCITNKL